MAVQGFIFKGLQIDEVFSSPGRDFIITSVKRLKRSRLCKIFTDPTAESCFSSFSIDSVADFFLSISKRNIMHLKKKYVRMYIICSKVKKMGKSSWLWVTSYNHEYICFRGSWASIGEKVRSSAFWEELDVEPQFPSWEDLHEII